MYLDDCTTIFRVYFLDLVVENYHKCTYVCFGYASPHSLLSCDKLGLGLGLSFESGSVSKAFCSEAMKRRTVFLLRMEFIATAILYLSGFYRQAPTYNNFSPVR